MLRKVIILLICLIFSVQTTYAIVENKNTDTDTNLTLNANSITLSKAIELGILNNPTLKIARAKLGISDAQILQAGLIPNPSIISDNGFAEDTFRVGIEQTIELGNKRSKRVKLARIQKEVVVQELVATTLDVRANVRTSYIQVYNSQQKLLTAQEILETTSKLANIAKLREEAGDIAKLDVLQAEIKMISAKNDIQNAKLELNKAFNSLSANIGQNLNRDIVLAPPDLLKEFNSALEMPAEENEEVLNTLIEKAYSTRPEILAIQKNIEAQNQRLKVARANIVPDLTVSAGADIVTGEEKRTSAFVIGSIDVPVFNHQQGVIKEIKAQKEVYEKELDAQKIIVAQEVKNAYSGIVANAQSLKIYENELIPHSKDVVEKSELSFKEGKSNILVPLNSQDAYIKTKFGYIQTLNEYEKSVSDLERAIGVGHE